ncbi:MAG: DUF4445 domain-containing protein [Actinomycetia bacterium]|nr:DUF4445 domain-containing protein [Actinomycetes bacterium]
MATPEGHRVVFTPSGLSGFSSHEETVLEVARRIGVDLDSVCGGRGICGRCQVEPSKGSFAKWAIESADDSLTPWSDLEAGYEGRRAIVEGRRLGCGARVLGDVVIDVPADSQIHKQVIRKDVNIEGLRLDPLVTLHYLPDAAFAAATLAADWGHSDVEIGDALPKAGDVTVAVRDGAVVAAWPGYLDRIVGFAVDIGSTTIAGHLCDLRSGEILATAGRMNPQIRFGEDLMSRVSYVMMNPGGDVELTSAVRGALDGLLGEVLVEAGIDRDQVLDIVLVGNPVMHHLALGLDPTPLGQAPFPLATEVAEHRTAAQLDIDAPNSSVYVGPCIAGHVGADTAAAILSEGPHRSEVVQLLVDVGTNAEIVLGNNKSMFAASSPTGPAFEGAQISAGQRATAGAIERVRIDPDTLRPHVRVIGCELWSDEEGFAEATARPGVTGICGSGIIEALSELVRSGAIDRQGVIVGDHPSASARIVADGRTNAYVLHGEPGDPAAIKVVQADVRAIQLAKAALKAGIDVLLEHAGLPLPDEIRLAGAFGAHIDPAHAMTLGLIPDLEVDRVRAVGNSAGSGAVRALLSGEQRLEMEQTVADVTKIETATEPRFQDLFVTALAFPHSPNVGSDGAELASRGRRGRRRATGSG